MDYQEWLDGIDRKAYHEGEWQWEEDGMTVTRTYHYSPPGCHDSCGVLIYTKDDEFVRIRDGLDRYRHDANVLIEHGRLDEVALDGDTWNAWLETHPFDELNERIAKINDSEIYDVDMLGYLPAFEMLEFSTIGDLKRMVDEDSERAFDLAERQLGGTGLDIVSSTVGLQNLCVAHALKMGMGEVGLRLLFESLGTSSHYAARRAQSVLRLCE